MPIHCPLTAPLGELFHPQQWVPTLPSSYGTAIEPQNFMMTFTAFHLFQ